METDTRGYIWIGSDHGLSCYDGQQFKNFSSADGLLKNSVYKIKKYKEYFILFHLYGGLTFFDPIKQNSLTLAAQSAIAQLLKEGRVRDLIIDDNANVYFSKYPELCDSSSVYYYSFQLEDSTVLQHQIPVGNIFDNCISGRLKIGQQWLSIGAEQNILFPMNQNLEKQAISIGDTMILYNQEMPSYLEWKDSLSVYYNDRGIWLCKEARIIHQITPLAIGRLNNVKVVDDFIFLMAEKGLFKCSYDNVRLKLEQITAQPNISNIYIDKNDNLWIGTLDKGIFLLPSIRRALKRDYQYWGEEGEVVAIATGSTKKVWYLTKSGQLWEQQKGENENFLTKRLAQLPNFLRFHLKELQLGPDSILVFKKDGYYDLKSQQFVYKKEEKSNTYIYSFLYQSDTLYLGHAAGLNYKTSSIPVSESINTKGELSRTYKLAAYDAESILLGQDKGLFLYHKKNKSVHSTALHQRVSDIAVGSTKICFVGTHGSGLWIGNPYKQEWITFQKKNGLLSNFIEQIELVEQPNNYQLWVSTNTDLGCLIFNKELELIEQFYLSGRYFPSLTSVNDMKVVNDQIYIASKLGVERWSTARIFEHFHRSSPLYIQSLIVDGIEAELLDSNTLDLAAGTKSIEIQFQILDFYNVRPTYFYRLKGKSDWQTTSNSSVMFVDLAPGYYSFEVCTNPSTLKQLDKINFYVQPFFTQTWIFYGLVIGLISLLIFGGVGYYSYLSQLRVQYLKSRYGALQNQINPHFIFNSLNMLSYFIYKNMLDAAGNYLHDFSALLRGILNNSTHDFIPIAEELEVLSKFIQMEATSAPNNKPLFQYTIEITTTKNLNEWYIAPMLIQPIIENAITHGLKPKNGIKKLKFSIQENETMSNYLDLIIDDNGIGRAASKRVNEKRLHYKNKHYSSLKNIEQRIKTINNLFKQHIKLEIIDKKNAAEEVAGTQVILSISQYFPKSTNLK